MSKICILLPLTMLMYSCGENNIEESTTALTEPSNLQAQSEIKPTLEEIKIERYAGVKAINLWKNSLRKEPKNKNGGWVSGGSVLFGETLTMLGDTAVDGDYTYAKVSTASKKIGWIRLPLIAPNYKIAVTTQNLKLYSSPDPLAVGDDKVESGTLLAVDDNKESGWIEIIVNEKKISGWAKSISSVSSDPVDLELATLLKRIRLMKDQSQQIERLKEIISDSSYGDSSLLLNAEDLYAELTNNEIFNREDESESIGVEEEIISEPLENF